MTGVPHRRRHVSRARDEPVFEQDRELAPSGFRCRKSDDEEVDVRQVVGAPQSP